MIKQFVLGGLVLCLSQPVFATANRVIALGGSPVMIADDDTNIDVFPQTINRTNLFRLTRIDSGTPDYAIVLGEKGDKWGLYGGEFNSDDFLNVFRSLGENSAIKLGARIGRHSEENTTDDNEATPDTSKEENDFYNASIDLTYGFNRGDQELAFSGLFVYGPSTISYVDNVLGLDGPHGNYSVSTTSGGTTSKADGKGKDFTLAASAQLRQPVDVLVFKNIYVNAGGFYRKFSSEFSASATDLTLEDSADRTIQLFGSILLFDEKKINEGNRLFYGLGVSGVLSRLDFDDKVNNNSSEQTNLTISGPAIRLGLESDVKYAKLRFGIRRDFNLLFYSDAENTFESGTNPDEQRSKTFDILYGGSYSFSSGLGISYKNLQIDVTLQNIFWRSGPQMIFDTGNGTIAASADVLYTF